MRLSVSEAVPILGDLGATHSDITKGNCRYCQKYDAVLEGVPLDADFLSRMQDKGDYRPMI